MKVRIAVVTFADGCFVAGGGYDSAEPGSDEVVNGFIKEAMEEGVQDHGAAMLTYVEADVPQPTTETVEGKVVG